MQINKVQKEGKKGNNKKKEMKNTHIESTHIHKKKKANWVSERNRTNKKEKEKEEEKEEESKEHNKRIDLVNDYTDNMKINTKEESEIDDWDIEFENSDSIDNNTAIENEETKKQDLIDYVTYINNLNNSKDQNTENISINKENEELRNDEKSNQPVFKIFLLFSPLATTIIKKERRLIDADECLINFEEKIQQLESLFKIETREHDKFILKRKIETIQNKLDNVRCDILFFTMLALRDSILNKKRKLQVYIHTVNNELIYISPSFRVPRSFSLFKKVMLMLLNERTVYNQQQEEVLMKILPNPITDYIEDSICIGFSNKGFPVDIKKLTDKIKGIEDTNFSFFLSISEKYDITEINKKKNQKQEFHKIPFQYHFRISDLKLSPALLTSKITHFLNS